MVDVFNIATIKSTIGVSKSISTVSHNMAKIWAVLCITYSLVLLSIAQEIMFDDLTSFIENQNGKIVFTDLFCKEHGNVEFLLGLKSMEIQEIASDSLHQCSELEYLIMPNNSIESLHPDTFKYNLKLEYIDLSYNLLSDIPKLLFSHLPELKWLDLSYNLFKTIHPVLESGAKQLYELDLRNNRITVEDDFDVNEVRAKLPELARIKLTYNYIECTAFETLVKNLASISIDVETDEDEEDEEDQDKDKKCLSEQNPRITEKVNSRACIQSIFVGFFPIFVYNTFLILRYVGGTH